MVERRINEEITEISYQNSNGIENIHDSELFSPDSLENTNFVLPKSNNLKKNLRKFTQKNTLKRLKN